MTNSSENSSILVPVLALHIVETNFFFQETNRNNVMAHYGTPLLSYYAANALYGVVISIYLVVKSIYCGVISICDMVISIYDVVM